MMNKSRSLIILAGTCLLLVSLAALVAPRLSAGSNAGVEVVDAVPVKVGVRKADTGLCPWRNPEDDLKRFFPSATATRDETLVLSGFRPAITRRLGHAPVGGDSALRVHRVLQGETPLGVILTRNVRGESGVIELVLAVNTAGKVTGARLQRLREPDEVAHSLQAAEWLGAFCGNTADSTWQVGRDLPDVPPGARASADAIADGARTVLVLLDVGRTASVIR